MRSYPWHSLSIPEVVQHFNTSAERGLEASAAALRLRDYGSNALTKTAQESLLARLLRQTKTPLVFVLIIAGLAAFSLGELIDATVIAVALLVNIVIGFVQEGRAGNAFDALKDGEALKTLVLRDGKRHQVPVEDLVVGDIVLLRAGKQIPADVRLIEVSDLSVNEAALTGEWVPVPKHIDVLSEDRALTQQKNCGFRGTTIVTGKGRGVVVAVGDDTQVGQIAKELQSTERIKTPLEGDMEGIARFVLFLVMVSAAGITALGVYRGEPLTDMVLIAIAIAVSAIPEGLPAAVTASLAIGMERILKYGGLVKNLLAAEILGTTTYILTDKTGTLTKGRMALVEYALLHERTKEVDAIHTRKLLQAGAYASDAVLDEDQTTKGHVVHGRPIERAILLSSLHAGIAPVGKHQLFSIPFSSERRFGGAVIEEDGAETLYVSGAPESLLHKSVKLYDGITERTLTEADADVFNRYLKEYTKQGLRVIGIAQKSLTEGEGKRMYENVSEGAEQLTFMGLMVFADQIREDVEESICRIKDAGARVVMVTGDNPNTALYVASEVGICGKDEQPIIGSEIEQMSDKQLLEALRTHFVFARVLPIQKLRIARLLRSAKEVVAMTGDGINDAPALQAASIGIAVGSGTDVAKEAADLVLLDDSFSIIVKTIEEGRRMRDNIKKAVTFLLATNFSEILLIVVALVAGLALPILPTQILWANIVGEGFLTFAFAFEPADKKTMKRSPKDVEITNILSANVLKFIFLAGFIIAGLLLVLYIYLLSIGAPIEEIRTMLFVGLSFDALFLAFSMKSFSKPLWEIDVFSNRYLIGAFFISLLTLMAALFIPVLSNLLSLVPLSSLEIGLLALLGLCNVLAIEFSKWVLFRTEKTA